MHLELRTFSPSCSAEYFEGAPRWKSQRTGREQTHYNQPQQVANLRTLSWRFSRPSPVDYENAISRILNSIQRYIDSSPSLTLQGRVDSVRIDCNPALIDITGITQRLQTARQRGGFTTQTEYDDADVRDTWEDLLRRLVKCAVEHEKSLHPNKKEFVSYTLHYSFRLAFSGKGLDRMGPTTHDKRDKVVAFVVHKLRQRVLAVAGAAQCLPSKASLDRPALSPDEYEDLLEQQLYAFRRNTVRNSRPRDGGDWYLFEKDLVDLEEILEEHSYCVVASSSQWSMPGIGFRKPLSTLLYVIIYCILSSLSATCDAQTP
ncbi:hypothetical protein AC578_888 [Pseudocercospora eumusae]|uniref:Uncharacterized protein n=1 Tax=Pseudocercospora eumusae TaxID=321146 RepID=A0A139H454_9PEZI|nr:hypothetical protein AC578_888 [Pseudocercospora eumusae]